MIRAEQEKDEDAKANKGNIPFGNAIDKVGDGKLNRANFKTE